ncbi:hypothetical protein PHMEG_00034246, partial [Phytophthora megakarya]
RPFLLAMARCLLYISKYVVDTTKSLHIVLVRLPPNAIHLLQPLHVAVLSSFKLRLKSLIDVLVAGNCEGPSPNPAL